MQDINAKFIYSNKICSLFAHFDGFVKDLALFSACFWFKRDDKALIYLHRVPNPQTVRDIEEDFIMGVTYIIAIVAAVVLLALNLIRDYGKKG